MLTALSKINAVAVIYPESTQRHAKSCVTYSRLDSLQKQMVQKFQLSTFLLLTTIPNVRILAEGYVGWPERGVAADVHDVAGLC
jgi:hypothetical protein